MLPDASDKLRRVNTRNPAALEEARHRALADSNRRRMLRILEDLGEPTDVESLSTLLELHPNTVRAHLEVMEDAGLVVRSSESRTIPGRPKLLYARAHEDGPSQAGGYRLLAEMLTTSLRIATDDASRASEEAGRVWGHYLTGPMSPNETLSQEEVVARISGLLEEIGFEPHTEGSGSRTTIDLGDCPFRELAKTQGNVVCSIHLGLLRGSAEALGGTASVESLEPFVEPSLCRAVLRT